MGHHKYTAILVDGGYFTKRYKSVYGAKSPKQTADFLFEYCLRHLKEKHIDHKLYRIFYYDCPPIDRTIYNPITQKSVNLGKSDTYSWTTEFLYQLSTKRKIALRMGKISDMPISYIIKPTETKKLLRKEITIDEIDESSLHLNITQKGVDMRIGLDISSLAFKKQVGQIVLIAGDSDFVPAAKLARREGVDFVLDPLGSGISKDLFEHIDAKRTVDTRFNSSYK